MSAGIRWSPLAVGVVFGFLLTASGLGDYTTIHDGLLLRNPYIFLMLGSAMLVAVIGLAVLRRGGGTAFAGRLINTHPAPLPRFGGQGMFGEHVHRAVLQAGVAASAATVHLVDEEYDSGPVIAERPVPILPDDDVATLRERVQAAERALLVSTISDIADVQQSP